MEAQEANDEQISIHALREEGDAKRTNNKHCCHHFYPRPPRGGRPLPGTAPVLHRGISIHALCEEGDSCARPGRPGPYISIHALREEGDRLVCCTGHFDLRFLSTPSARRATAKTETKSLFSNKLYNILHEFRRALIYNGSKNYPNHAK